MFATFWAAVSGKLIALLVLTAIDLIFGVILALIQKRFEWSRLTDYLQSNGLPILGWLAAEAIILIPGEFIPGAVEIIAPNAVYATVFGKILASVAGHFSAMGIIPQPLQRLGIKPTGYPKG